jgi:flagellar biosynthesis component FlhA
VVVTNGAQRAAVSARFTLDSSGKQRIDADRTWA